MRTPVIRKILVPTDYSPNAKKAAQMAVSMAKQLRAEVFVFHSFSVPVVGLAEGIVIADDIKQVQGEELDRYLSELKAESGDVNLHGILEFGTPADWIPTLAETRGIDLIVMGTKGNTDPVNTIFGSVTSHIINQVKCPVLIIPKGCSLYAINELIFASDFHFTENSATYMAPLLQLIDEFEPFVHLVHFSTTKIPQTHAGNIEEMKLAEIFKNTKHSFHYMETQDVEEALFEFTKKYHGDLIVAVTRNYTIWEKIFHRSLTKKLALHSDVPLLILHEV